MNKTVNMARKAAVLCVGVAILLVGIVFLILPGPGLLICALALFVLSIEFPSAKKILDWGKSRWEKFRASLRTG
jgi:uncharacterized protein (TIGR02611 family)